ncbi:hypothetical protein [Bacteroides neonati]|uniref:hypothetical protein n=1 Tax=Bacteroides neonati TaxID=1347393 RepID=UPI0004AE8EAD|nr:hypothetical protein [Bacteroides neonati]
MESKTIGSVEFTNYMEELIKNGVDEIVENKKENYTFLIGNYWYNIKCQECSYGYRFYVKLARGINISSMDETVFISPQYSNSEKKKFKGLFDCIEIQYIKHKIFDNEKIARYFKNYIQLIERCTQILRLTENVFIVYIDDIKYSFERSEKYISKDCPVQINLLINRYIDGRSEKIYEKMDYRKNEAIFSVLNAVYYLNQTERDLEIRNDINAILNLK